MEWRFALICAIILAPFASDAQQPPLGEEERAQLVYQRINKTLIERLPLYEKRAVCITANLIRNNAIQSFNESYLNFTYVNDSYSFAFVNETEAMEPIEAMIASANFACTVVGFVAIFIICTVLLTVITCVACLQN